MLATSRCPLCSLLTVVAVSFLAASAQAQQEVAEAYVDASWADAQAVARVLVARDFQEALNEVADWLQISAGSVDSEGLMAARQAVVEALKLASSSDLSDVASSEVQLDQAMKLYRDATARRYRLSWYSVEPLLATAALPKLLRRAHEGLETRCAQGAALPADDFLTAPRPALPGFRLNFTARLWYQTGEGESGLGADMPTFDSPGSKTDDSREFWYGVGYAAGAAICAATVYGAPAVSLCAAAGAALVGIIYALVDLFDNHGEIVAMADAEAYRLNNRAIARDVSALYREYCSYGVDAVQRLVASTEMTAAEQQNLLDATSKADVDALLERLKTEQQARCHISLQAAYAAGHCPALGTPLVDATYAKDPSCVSTDDRGARFDCPLVVTRQDSFCRVAPNGTLRRLPVEPQADGKLRIRDGLAQEDSQPLCELRKVADGYSTSADREFLRALASERQDLSSVEKEATVIATYLATRVILTLQAAEQLEARLQLGEEELDRQQAFALRNIQRLIRIIRLRRQALTVQARFVGAERAVAGPAAQSLVDLTAAMIAETDDPGSMEKVARLSEVAGRATRDAAVKLPGSVAIDQLRVMAEQLKAVNQ